MDIKLLTSQKDIAKYFKCNGLTLKLEGIKEETIEMAFGTLPEGIQEKYSQSLHLLYKGTYLSLYFQYQKPRIGGGTLELANEIYTYLKSKQ